MRHSAVVAAVSIAFAWGLLACTPSGTLVTATKPVEHVTLPRLVAELRLQWPNNRTVNIVAFGNSVPAGYARTPEVRPFDAYPHLLHQKLNAAFPYAVINVINSGVGGETSEGGLARLTEDVLAYSPDVVLVDYGLNDRGIGIGRSRKALAKIVLTLKASKALIVLMTPTVDSNANLADPNDPLNVEADMIRQLAKDEGVVLVDSLAAFKAFKGKPETLLAQSNHPSRLGHEIVAAELMAVFTPPVAGSMPHP